ncbi:MAG: hypothetical protein ACRED7_12325 [Stellaceae bacterium]
MKNDAVFFFQLPSTLLDQVRHIANDNALSASAFVRQSIIRNARAYRADDAAEIAARQRSANLRYP